MVIRFQCGSCSEPIEIDDEWASKSVACPYCRKTVTAPAESTLSDADEIPTAVPLSPGAMAPAVVPSLSTGPSPVLVQRNAMAVAAAVLASCLVGLMLAITLVLTPHAEEMEEFQQALSSAGGFAEMVKAQAEFYESRGGVPSWMIAVGALEGAMVLVWIATLVCGIIAVRRPHRHALSVAALVVAGLTPLMFCCGGLVGL